jgi:hypothetical protein
LLVSDLAMTLGAAAVSVMLGMLGGWPIWNVARQLAIGG